MFSHFLSNSCGVAILIRPNMSFDLRFVKHIVKGRCIHLYIAIKDVVSDIVNVYAPSGDGTECTNLYTTVREYLLQNIGQNVTVMAGDLIVHSTPSVIEQARFRGSSILLNYYVM